MDTTDALILLSTALGLLVGHLLVLLWRLDAKLARALRAARTYRQQRDRFLSALNAAVDIRQTAASALAHVEVVQAARRAMMEANGADEAPESGVEMLNRLYWEQTQGKPGA